MILAKNEIHSFSLVELQAAGHRNLRDKRKMLDSFLWRGEKCHWRNYRKPFIA